MYEYSSMYNTLGNYKVHVCKCYWMTFMYEGQSLLNVPPLLLNGTMWPSSTGQDGSRRLQRSSQCFFWTGSNNKHLPEQMRYLVEAFNFGFHSPLEEGTGGQAKHHSLSQGHALTHCLVNGIITRLAASSHGPILLLMYGCNALWLEETFISIWCFTCCS